MKRGFTLIEALITLLLVMIMLGAIGTLMQMYANVIRHSGAKETTLYAAEMALEAVKGELAQAIEVTDPSSGSTSVDELTLVRLDPWSPARLPEPAPDPPPAAWEPHALSDRMTVRFTLVVSASQEYAFMKQVTYPDGSSYEEPVCSGVSGITFESLGDGTILVRATVFDEATQRAVPLSALAGTQLPARLIP